MNYKGSSIQEMTRKIVQFFDDVQTKACSLQEMRSITTLPTLNNRMSYINPYQFINNLMSYINPYQFINNHMLH